MSGNLWGAGWTFTSLGAAYRDRDLGKLDDALDAAKHALTVWQELDDQQGAGIALNNLGDVYRELGFHNKAIACYEQAPHVTRTIGNRWGKAWALNSIGKAKRDLGDADGLMAGRVDDLRRPRRRAPPRSGRTWQVHGNRAATD